MTTLLGSRFARSAQRNREARRVAAVAINGDAAWAPLAMVSAFLPDVLAGVVMAPLEAMVRVVWWTATLAQHLSPHGMWNVFVWVMVAVVVAKRARCTAQASGFGDRVVATYVNGRLSGHR